MEINYQNSLLYQINSSAKYFDMLFDQLFKEFNFGITPMEHLALCIITQTENCCQRDLAKIILKDRANTGKLALKLQKKGLIRIETKTKNNKPIKILSATENGIKLNHDIIIKLEPIGREIKEGITQKKLDALSEGLKSFRNTVQKAVKINI